jgi:CheY-like chemotaxis protein
MPERPIHILLVDDDEVTNFLSREMLRIFLHDPIIDEVLNGQDALSYLKDKVANQESLPHLILLDINMPIMDGWEFLKEFEQLTWPGLEAISVVMFTSSVYHEDIDKARSFTIVREIFSKPLDEEKIRAIAALCRP